MPFPLDRFRGTSPLWHPHWVPPGHCHLGPPAAGLQFDNYSMSITFGHCPFIKELR